MSAGPAPRGRVAAEPHDRHRPGLNHLAFHGGAHESVDALVAACTTYGWTLLFSESHPYAGGPDHHAAYLVNTDGFEVELVANR